MAWQLRAGGAGCDAAALAGARHDRVPWRRVRRLLHRRGHDPVRPTYPGWQMSSCSEDGRGPASGPPAGAAVRLARVVIGYAGGFLGVTEVLALYAASLVVPWFSSGCGARCSVASR